MKILYLISTFLVLPIGECLAQAGNWKWLIAPEHNEADVVTPVLCADKLGNIYLAINTYCISSLSGNFFPKEIGSTVYKFGSSGKQLGRKAIGGYIVHMAVDSSGDLIVAGNLHVRQLFGLDKTAGPNIFLEKIDPAGKTKWHLAIGDSSRESISSMIVDKSANIYLTGSYRNYLKFPNYLLADTSRMFVAKLDPSGILIWARSGVQLAPGKGRFTDGYSLVSGQDSSLYFVGQGSGYSYSPHGFFSGFKISSSGLVQDIFRIGNSMEFPRHLHIDSRQNFFYAQNQCSHYYDCPVFFKAEYGQNILWDRNLGDLYDGLDLGSEIGVSPSGRIFAAGSYQKPWPPHRTKKAMVCGDSVEVKLGSEPLMQELDPDSGALLHCYEGSGTANEKFSTMVFDGAGNCIVAGLRFTLKNLDSSSLRVGDHILKFDQRGTRLFLGRLEFHPSAADTTRWLDYESKDKPLVEERRFIIYPNPASKSLTIERLDSEVVTLEIRNLFGSLILSESLMRQKSIIDISGLPPGLFYIQLNGSTSFKGKLVVK